VFGGQDVHALAREAPVLVEYVFVPQLMHEAEPIASLYLPAPQSVHEAEPIASLYFPAAHSEHVSPSAPVYPALH